MKLGIIIDQILQSLVDYVKKQKPMRTEGITEIFYPDE